LPAKQGKLCRQYWDIGKQFNAVLQDFGIFSPLNYQRSKLGTHPKLEQE
jgi:hypothetical protein